MREIKFQFLYKGLPFSSENSDFRWHKKVYTLDQLCLSPLSAISDVHGQAELVAKRQFTGAKDINGVDIYEGDILRGQYYDYVLIVKFLESTFRAFFIEYKEDDQYEWLFDNDCDLEVIGNIHENTYLLVEVDV